MKILSISDVITNSSSEVFCYYDKLSDKRLKGLLGCILETFGVDEKVEDVFNIEYFLSDYAEEDMTEGEALEEISNSYDMPYIDGYKITSKSEKYNKLCKLLSQLDVLFDYEEVYN